MDSGARHRTSHSAVVPPSAVGHLAGAFQQLYDCEECADVLLVILGPTAGRLTPDATSTRAALLRSVHAGGDGADNTRLIFLPSHMLGQISAYFHRRLKGGDGVVRYADAVLAAAADGLAPSTPHSQPPQHLTVLMEHVDETAHVAALEAAVRCHFTGRIDRDGTGVGGGTAVVTAKALLDLMTVSDRFCMERSMWAAASALAVCPHHGWDDVTAARVHRQGLPPGLAGPPPPQLMGSPPHSSGSSGCHSHSQTEAAIFGMADSHLRRRLSGMEAPVGADDLLLMLQLLDLHHLEDVCCQGADCGVVNFGGGDGVAGGRAGGSPEPVHAQQQQQQQPAPPQRMVRTSTATSSSGAGRAPAPHTCSALSLSPDGLVALLRSGPLVCRSENSVVAAVDLWHQQQLRCVGLRRSRDISAELRLGLLSPALISQLDSMLWLGISPDETRAVTAFARAPPELQEAMRAAGRLPGPPVWYCPAGEARTLWPDDARVQERRWSLGEREMDQAARTVRLLGAPVLLESPAFSHNGVRFSLGLLMKPDPLDACEVGYAVTAPGDPDSCFVRCEIELSVDGVVVMRPPSAATREAALFLPAGRLHSVPLPFPLGTLWIPGSSDEGGGEEVLLGPLGPLSFVARVYVCE